MATPIHEKQRRGFKYFFRSSSKNDVPKSEPDDVVMMPSKSPMSDMLSRKSKNYAAKLEPEPEPDDVVIMPSKSPMSENVMLSRKSRDFQETVVVVGGRRGAEMKDIGRGGGKVVKMVEARKSVSHVETNLTSAVSFLQVKVLVSDMPGFMQVHAFRCARITYDSLEQFSSKHIAYNMKKEFDKEYGPAWHCIVGSSFGSYVTHSTGCFLYFSMEKLYILVFQTKVQKAATNHDVASLSCEGQATSKRNIRVYQK